MLEDGHQWIPTEVEWAHGLLNLLMNHLGEGMNNAKTKDADDVKLFIAGLTTKARVECETDRNNL